MTMPVLDKSEGIALITDGSANYKDRTGGWAYVALDAFDGIHADSRFRADTTIGEMELVAPTRGLEWLLSHCGPCEVLVYCDAEYVVLGAMNRNRKRNKNKGLWKELDRAMRAHEHVEFQHVKGHAGHKWNELADKLAGEARRQGVK